jgi:hypothetical protein
MILIAQDRAGKLPQVTLQLFDLYNQTQFQPMCDRW